MRVHIAFVPDAAASGAVGIVIDVLRATSTVIPRFAGVVGSAAEVVA